MSNYRFCGFELSESNFCLSREGQRVPLEPKALRVLTVLVSQAGTLVDKQELLQLVWPDTFVEENTLTRTIAVLRKQLGDSSRGSKLIETVPTRGYRFIAEVEILPEQIKAAALPATAQNHGTVLEAGSEPVQDERASEETAARVSQARRTTIGAARRNWLLLTACLFLAVAAALWTWHRRAHAETPIRSLAVLPLDDLSPGVKEDYFADGLTDELITELARIPDLRVVSRTSIMQDKGSHKSLRQIAQELNVDAIVEGSVVRSGNRVRITAQLIDARSDRHLWAENFEGELGDILSLQNDVARRIASQTSTVLKPSALSGPATTRQINPDAHDAYLRGLYFIQRRDAELAVSYFRKAIALAPEYAAADAGLAEALATEVMTNGVQAAGVIPDATAAAKRAIELDPGSGEAYTALGAIETVYDWDWGAAELNLRKGIELSPGSSDAETWYAIYLTSVGRPAEAVTAMRRAVALDPLSFWANRLLGSMLYYSRQYDESLSAIRRALELAPDKIGFVAGWESGNYEMQGRYSDAFEADMEELALDLPPKDLQSFRLAFKAGGWTRYQDARLKYLISSADQCSMNPIAMSYLRLHDDMDALRWFNRDIDSRCGRTVFDLSSDPRLDALRQNPRFRDLLRRVNLPH